MASNGIDRTDLPRAMSSQDDLMKATSDLGGRHKEIRTGHLDEKKLKNFFIGAIDAGTTSSRFLVFDGTGNPVAQHQIEFTQKYPQSG
jgi:glycerol kinase